MPFAGSLAEHQSLIVQRADHAGAVWDLSDLAPRAKANKANCQQLSAYTQDMLRIFELKGLQYLPLPLIIALTLALPEAAFAL